MLEPALVGVLIASMGILTGLVLGRREERERCAAICDAEAECERGIRADTGAFWRLLAAARIAARIRGGDHD